MLLLLLPYCFCLKGLKALKLSLECRRDSIMQHTHLLLTEAQALGGHAIAYGLRIHFHQTEIPLRTSHPAARARSRFAAPAHGRKFARRLAPLRRRWEPLRKQVCSAPTASILGP